MNSLGMGFGGCGGKGTLDLLLGDTARTLQVAGTFEELS